MKVGVEGIPIFGNHLTGVGQYQKNLLAASSRASKNIYFEIIRQSMPHKRIKKWPINPNSRLSYRIVRWLPPTIYFQTYKRTGRTLPYEWAVHKRYDAVLFFNFVAYPVTKKTKSVVVVHDLSFIYHKKYVSPPNQAWLEKFVPRSIDRANKIIAVSQNTKNEIIKYYKVSPDKISVIYPAVDHGQFKPLPNNIVSKATKKFGINKPYILSVGTIEPRKNLLGVLNAFESLPDDLKQSHALVLVGGKGWLDDRIESKYKELAAKYTVIKTGYVEDADLPALYSGASVFVYPAFYEGFGIPPLEAMACGVPVIVSNNSSLPEVVGDAAITISANDTAQIASSITQVLRDKKLADSLSKKGIARASQFSWDKSAKQLLDLLENLTS